MYRYLHVHNHNMPRPSFYFSMWNFHAHTQPHRSDRFLLAAGCNNFLCHNNSSNIRYSICPMSNLPLYTLGDPKHLPSGIFPQQPSLRFLLLSGYVQHPFFLPLTRSIRFHPNKSPVSFLFCNRHHSLYLGYAG